MNDVVAAGRSRPVADVVWLVWLVPLLFLLSWLAMVGVGGPDRGSKVAVMAAPKILAPKISADMILIGGFAYFPP